MENKLDNTEALKLTLEFLSKAYAYWKINTMDKVILISTSHFWIDNNTDSFPGVYYRVKGLEFAEPVLKLFGIKKEECLEVR